jgi:hypothetical protein
MQTVLVKASGLNRRPACACSAKTGMKLSVMMSSEKHSAGPTSVAALMIARSCASLPWTS